MCTVFPHSVSARVLWLRLISIGTLAIAMGFLMHASAGPPGAESSGPTDGSTTLQASILKAVELHASPEVLGKLWLTLANRYLDQFELQKAEEAYTHAIRLLHGTPSQAQYADSLRGIGTVYRTSGRLKQARKYLTSSLGIYEALNDRPNVAYLHLALGLERLAERKYREAEAETTAALEEFESGIKLDLSDLSAAYLTRSRAVCGEGRCGSALQDVSRAHNVAQNRFHENSIEMISIWLVQGYVQMQAGLQTEGQLAMNEALRLAQSRTDLPRPFFVALQLAVLRAQAVALKAADRKQKAKHAQDQIAQIEAEARSRCNGCTVSVAALVSP